MLLIKILGSVFIAFLAWAWISRKEIIMNHVSLVEVLTSSGTEYQVVREDGVILAFTYIKHYADVIFNAIASDIDKNDADDEA